MTEAQWLTIYRETIHHLYRYISHRTGGEHDLTEDIVQETYVRALRHWTSKKNPVLPLPWLKRVATNLLISYFRKIHWKRLEDLDLNTENERIHNPLIGPIGQQVYWALSFLKKSQAKILEAFHFDEKSMKEIGIEMGISERAVEGRLRRARQALKKQLVKRYK